MCVAAGVCMCVVSAPQNIVEIHQELTHFDGGKSIRFFGFVWFGFAFHICIIEGLVCVMRAMYQLEIAHIFIDFVCVCDIFFICCGNFILIA